MRFWRLTLARRQKAAVRDAVATGAAIRVIDAQVHAYAANTPERPWHSVPNWPAHITGDEMVAAKDKVGIGGAIYFSPFSMYQYEGNYAVSVQRAHPDKFALVKPVNADDPTVADVIADWKILGHPAASGCQGRARLTRRRAISMRSASGCEPQREQAMVASTRLRQIDDEALIGEGPVMQPTPQKSARATGMLLLALKALSQRFVLALASLTDLALAASVFVLVVMIISNPSALQLAGAAGYALFVMGTLAVRRRP